MDAASDAITFAADTNTYSVQNSRELLPSYYNWLCLWDMSKAAAEAAKKAEEEAAAAKQAEEEAKKKTEAFSFWIRDCFLYWFVFLRG